MAEITEILTRILEIAERITQTEEVSTVVMGIYGIVLVFGILNCVLGYRLLRFWVMLFGFAAGAFAGLFLVRSMDVQDKTAYLGAMLGLGVVFGVVSFMIYKLGIFILGAGIAWTLSIYILHPTTSAVFFVCILCGVIVGTLGVRFAKEVIIVGTSLLGGVMSGFALSKLGNLAEIPYGIAMSAGFVLLGFLIQFATNRSRESQEDDAEEKDAPSYGKEREETDYDDYEEYEDDTEKELRHQAKRPRGNVPDIQLERKERKNTGH